MDYAKRPVGCPPGDVVGEVATHFAGMRSNARRKSRARRMIRRTILAACPSAWLEAGGRTRTGEYVRELLAVVNTN